MSLLYLAGELSNNLGRGVNPVTTAASGDALFPLANLYIGRPSVPFSWSQTIANMAVVMDGELLTDGGFEDPSIPAWIDADSGTAASTRDTGVKHEGAASLKLVPGASGTAQRFQDLTVRSGERLKLSVHIRQDGAGSVELFIQNTITGNFVDSVGSWSPASNAAAVNVADTSAAFVAHTVEFQVEGFAACGDVSTVDLRVIAFANDATLTAAYMDAVTIFPAVNFMGVFSHNFETRLVARMESSVDNFSSSTSHTPDAALRQPSFYKYLTTPVYERFWRILLTTGPQVAFPRIGELVFGYTETLAAAPSWGFQTIHRKDQQRNRTPGGEQHVTARGASRRRLSRWFFAPQAEAEVTEIRDEVLERCGYGEAPAVVVDTIKGDVIHGRFTDSLEVRRQFVEQWATDLLFEEDPHMNWIET